MLHQFAVLAFAFQQFGGMDAPRPKAKQFVEYIAGTHELHAGKPDVMELNFRVVEGYHVNSHSPRSELQIPTRLDLSADSAVQVREAQYPPGRTYRLPFESDETLNVYTGTFTVRMRVVASAGIHELKGSLTYQACDQAACYPLKTLPVSVSVVAR